VTDPTLVRHCKQYLEENGYHVIPKDRQFILDANYVVPPIAMQSLRSGEARWSDIALEANIQRISRAIIHRGLAVHLRQDVADDVTGAETVFSTAICLYSPNGNAS
jgi:hypothetical protein